MYCVVICIDYLQVNKYHLRMDYVLTVSESTVLLASEMVIMLCALF